MRAVPCNWRGWRGRRGPGVSSGRRQRFWGCAYPFQRNHRKSSHLLDHGDELPSHLIAHVIQRNVHLEHETTSCHDMPIMNWPCLCSSFLHPQRFRKCRSHEACPTPFHKEIISSLEKTLKQHSIQHVLFLECAWIYEVWSIPSVMSFWNDRCFLFWTDRADRLELSTKCVQNSWYS